MLAGRVVEGAALKTVQAAALACEGCLPICSSPLTEVSCLPASGELSVPSVATSLNGEAKCF